MRVSGRMGAREYTINEWAGALSRRQRQGIGRRGRRQSSRTRGGLLLVAGANASDGGVYEKMHGEKKLSFGCRYVQIDSWAGRVCQEIIVTTCTGCNSPRNHVNASDVDGASK